MLQLLMLFPLVLLWISQRILTTSAILLDKELTKTRQTYDT